MAGADSPSPREAALRRLVLAKRWIVAASVTLAGVLAAALANAFPGRTVQRASGAQESSSSAAPAEGSAQESQAGEEAPQVEQPEAAGQAAEAPVVSGGS
jgi:hypothetical protein